MCMCALKIFLKEGGEISLNGDVSLQRSSVWTFFLHVWISGPAVCLGCWHGPSAAGRPLGGGQIRLFPPYRPHC